MPGLVDFHTHPNRPAELLSHLVHGVTTVAAYDGEPLEWRRRRSPYPNAVLPNLLSTTGSIEGRAGVTPWFHALGRPQDVAPFLEREIGAGADMIKSYSKVALPEFRAIAAWAHANRVPHVGHIPEDVNLIDIFENGFDAVAHSEEYTRVIGTSPTESEIALAVELTARNKVAVVPNLVAYTEIEKQARDISAILRDPEAHYMAPAVYQSFLPANNSFARRGDRFADVIHQRHGLLKHITSRLKEAGVLLMAGTDAPIGFAGQSLLEEIQLLHEVGLSNFEALRAATRNPCLFLKQHSVKHAQEEFGFIGQGARADLLLLDRDPTADLGALASVAGVMANGVWLTRRALDAQRDSMALGLTRERAIVDRYETLLAHRDMTALFKFVDGLQETRLPLFDNEVIAADADAIAANGDPATAISLMLRTRPFISHQFSAPKVTGLLMMRYGEYEQAAQQFRLALDCMPEDIVAQTNLRLIGGR